MDTAISRNLMYTTWDLQASIKGIRFNDSIGFPGYLKLTLQIPADYQNAIHINHLPIVKQTYI